MVEVEEDAVGPLGDVPLEPTDVLARVDGPDLDHPAVSGVEPDLVGDGQVSRERRLRVGSPGQDSQTVRLLIGPERLDELERVSVGEALPGNGRVELTVVDLFVGTRPTDGVRTLDLDAVSPSREVTHELDTLERVLEKAVPDVVVGEQLLETRPAGEVAGQGLTLAETGPVETLGRVVESEDDAGSAVSELALGVKDLEHCSDLG